MKKMKNVKKLLLIGSLIFSINSVKAINFDTSFNINGDGSVTPNGIGYGSYTYQTEYKYYVNNDGKRYVAYCLDPQKQGSKSGTISVRRNLSADQNDDEVNSFDHGLMAMVAHENVTGLSGDELYLATSLAIRAFDLGLYNFGGASNLSAGYKAKASAIANLAVDWTDELGAYDLNKRLVAAKCSNKTCMKEHIKSLRNWYNPSITMNAKDRRVIDGAKKIFAIGVEAARNYYENKNNIFSITSKITNAETIKQDKNTIEEYIHAEISVNSIDSNKGVINNFKFSCPDCNKNGVTVGEMEYSILKAGADEWKTLDSSTDVAKDISSDSLYGATASKSGTIRIRVKITKNTDIEDCEPTKYSITFDYTNPSEGYTGAILGETGSADSVTQKFLIAEKNDANSPSKQSEVLNGTIDCGESVECQTEITTPICSDKEEEAVSSIKAPENIKKCILDKKDDANNSYTLLTDNGGLEKDRLPKEDEKSDRNDYCNVFCKEDYAEIKLNPIIEDVVCGGYFKLTSQIKGSKDCYTGGDTKDKSIDKEKYIQDVISAQEEMVSKYNDYLKWKESLNYIESESNKYDSKREEEDRYTNSEGEEVTRTICDSYGDCDGYNVEMDAGDGVLGYSLKNCNRETGVCTFAKDVALTNSYGEDGGKDGACNNGTCTPGKEGTLRSNIQERISKAETDLENAIEKYEQIVSDYNACTTGWSNDFKWQQKLKYEYDENQGEEGIYYRPYYDLIEDDNLYYLEAVEDENFKEESEIVICTGEANDKYECLSESITLKGDADKGKLQTYNYNSSYGDAFEYKEYVKCDKNGCKIDPDANVSKALFVRKTVKKEQNYVTPTAFYQIAANGKITVMGSGYPEDKVQLEELKNSLPVSTKAVGGGRFMLMLEDFGEFYDEKDELGRLIDYEGGKEEKSIAHLRVNNNVENAFDGNYECYYESPCRPKDCPNCDFTCEGSDCKWSECPDCTISCVNCVFNLDELEINFRTVSTTNFGSVGRTFGYNWITEETFNKLDLKKQEQLKLLKDKSTKTSDEIKDSNEMIYDPEGKTSDGSNALAFSIKLTPSAINDIKEYNKSQTIENGQIQKESNDYGGYVNDSLTCYDQGENKNIYCYSELIDYLVSNYDVTGVDNRLASDNERKNSEDQNNYWTTWPGYVYNESVIGGPSWK